MNWSSGIHDGQQQSRLQLKVFLGVKTSYAVKKYGGFNLSSSTGIGERRKRFRLPDIRVANHQRGERVCIPVGSLQRTDALLLKTTKTSSTLRGVTDIPASSFSTHPLLTSSRRCVNNGRANSVGEDLTAKGRTVSTPGLSFVNSSSETTKERRRW